MNALAKRTKRNGGFVRRVELGGHPRQLRSRSRLGPLGASTPLGWATPRSRIVKCLVHNTSRRIGEVRDRVIGCGPSFDSIEKGAAVGLSKAAGAGKRKAMASKVLRRTTWTKIESSDVLVSCPPFDR